ncbi:MAG: AraC family transcriptional regulator [Verrucomicrobiales bacterium]|nr:AraC family transcriptional regulator [Verrucomicrobiales bacterium]
MSSESAEQIQNRFLEELGGDCGFLTLFSLLNDVAFFVKNRDFQLVYANRFFYERLDLESDGDWLGKDDFQLFPEPLAAKFRKDDLTVVESGRPMDQLVELFLNRQGLPDWYVTNKLPVRGLSGAVIGVMGSVQRYKKTGGARVGDQKVEKVIELMHQSAADCGSMAKIATRMGMSHRQLDRRFKSATGLTPQQYLIRVRIEQACQKLRETEDDLSEIAYDLGFCDQSAFTAQFRKRMGLTPRKYRQQYGRRGR